MRPHYARRRRSWYQRLQVSSLCPRAGWSGLQYLGYALGRCRAFGEKRFSCQASSSPAGHSSWHHLRHHRSSQPYTRPGVPRPVHVLSRFWPRLHAISVPDTSRESLTTIADLASSMRTQTESMLAMQLQMDDMLRTIRPQQLLTMSIPKPSVSVAKVAQIFDDTPVGYVRGGVALDNETELFFSPSDWERLITPHIDGLGASDNATHCHRHPQLSPSLPWDFFVTQILPQHKPSCILSQHEVCYPCTVERLLDTPLFFFSLIQVCLKSSSSIHVPCCRAVTILGS